VREKERERERGSRERMKGLLNRVTFLRQPKFRFQITDVKTSRRQRSARWGIYTENARRKQREKFVRSEFKRNQPRLRQSFNIEN